MRSYIKKKLADIKRVIRGRYSKKDRQNDIQNTTQTTKDTATGTH